MKKSTGLAWYIVVFALLILSACGSGGGDANVGSGTIQMSITDAKPMLPAGASNLFVTFEEVLVHKSGESWISLPLAKTPYNIDLLQFQDGNVTELVPPTRLVSGKYTQVRIVVSSAKIRFDDGSTVEDKTVEVPSENLKTDKNFIFDVPEATAVDIVTHFDLSQSIVVSGPLGNSSYKLKPVLHLFDDPLKAATIKGTIADSSFVGSNSATVIVTADRIHEEYTRVEVPKSDTGEPVEFSIFWLVPNESYTVEIDLSQDDTVDFVESVQDDILIEGAIFQLNGGNPI